MLFFIFNYFNIFQLNIFNLYMIVNKKIEDINGKDILVFTVLYTSKI
jgi:hypothetical protein